MALGKAPRGQVSSKGGVPEEEAPLALEENRKRRGRKEPPGKLSLGTMASKEMVRVSPGDDEFIQNVNNHTDTREMVIA